MTSFTDHEVQALQHCIAKYKIWGHFTAALAVQQIIKVCEKYFQIQESGKPFADLK